jgi:hypothetical protein
MVKGAIHILPVEKAFVAETTMTVSINRDGARILTGPRLRPSSCDQHSHGARLSANGA